MEKPSYGRYGMAFIVITVMLDSVGFGIILPVTPQLIMELSGEPLSGTAYYIGWMWFAYAIMQFFFAPIIGNLSDHFGRRPVLLLAMFALGADYLIMAAAPTIIWLFVGRVVAGIAGSTYSTANAYIADISSPEKRAQNFGLIGAAFGVGFILGPVIGGLLGELGPRVPFYAAAVICFVNLLFGIIVLKETLDPSKRRRFSWKRANPIGALIHLKASPVVFRLAIAMFLYLLAHFALPTVWVVYVMEKFAWTESDIGFSLGFAGAMMVVVQGGLIRIIIPKIGAARAGYLGMLLMAVGFTGYAFSTQGWHLYLWLFVAALAGLVMPAFQSTMTSQVSENSQGELQGAIASLNGIAMIIGPLIMTRLFGYFSGPATPIYFPGAAFIVSAMLTIIALVLFYMVTKKAINQKGEFSV